MRGQVFIPSPKIRYFSTTEIAMFAERALLGGDPGALSARQVCCGTTQSGQGHQAVLGACIGPSSQEAGRYMEGPGRHGAHRVPARQMLLPEHLIKGNRFPNRAWNKCTSLVLDLPQTVCFSFTTHCDAKFSQYRIGEDNSSKI